MATSRGTWGSPEQVRVSNTVCGSAFRRATDFRAVGSVMSGNDEEIRGAFVSVCGGSDFSQDRHSVSEPETISEGKRLHEDKI